MCVSTRDLRCGVSAAVLLLCVSQLAGFSEARAQDAARGLSESFRKAAERVLPSVVLVRATLAGPGPARPDLPRARGFGLTPPAIVTPPEMMMAGPFPRPAGSGVVIDAARGFILTTASVIRGIPRIVVVLEDGTELPVQEIVEDPRSDLAVLSVSPGSVRLKQVEWGESGALQLGDWVLALGRTLSGSRAVSAGIVSGRELMSGTSLGEELEGIRTDARAAFSGFGGPLVNLAGQVVGINRLVLEPGAAPDGFGLAIPSEQARRVASDLIEHGRVRRGYLGLTLGPSQAASGERAPRLLVTGVAPSSPASEAGFQVGDRIITLDGRPIAGVDALSRAVETAPIGHEFRVEVERDGKRTELVVKTRLRPEPPGTEPLLPAPRGPDRRLRPRERGGLAPPREDRVLQSEGPEEAPAARSPKPAPPPSAAPPARP